MAGLALPSPGQPGRLGPHPFLHPGPRSGETELRRLRALAGHDFRVVGRLNHIGLLKPRDLVESELGIGLVYPREEDWQRLDLWLTEQRGPLPLGSALGLVRQIGETVK